MSHNHQQVIKARRSTAREDFTARRDDPFARLVAEVAADPANPFNIERYLWVLEEPPARPCGWCGVMFDPWFDYAGDAARGLPRGYCSTLCRDRAAWARRCSRSNSLGVAA